MASTQYDQFGDIDDSHREHRIIPQRGLKSKLVYILYGVLVLLLLILLLVTGLKFSLMTKEIADVKHYLEILHNGLTSAQGISSSQPGDPVENVHFDELEPEVAVRGNCDEGWVSFQTSCYLLSTSDMNWKTAEQACLSHGAHLVVLNSVEELDYISKVIDFAYAYWIGLVERRHEGHWTWVDGTDFQSTPSYWDVGQPDNWDYVENGEDCGQMHPTQRRKRKRWNDADCSLAFRYICETKN